jgi:hypothetical protein
MLPGGVTYVKGLASSAGRVGFHLRGDTFGLDVVTPWGRFDAREFYVRQEDCVKAWPGLAPQATEQNKADATESLPRRPGRKPKGNWKVEVATEVGLHMREGQSIPTAKSLAEFCRDQLDVDVDIREIQRWLRELGC